MTPETLERLLFVLRGKEDEDLLGLLDECREMAFENAKSHWRQKMIALDPARGESLYERLSVLPLAHYRRLAHAPEVWTYFLLERSTKNQMADESFSEWVMAEEVLCGRAQTLSAPCWTALGDVFLEPVDGTWRKKITARRLASGPVLDWQSPTTCAPLPEIRGDGRRWPAAAGERACRRMQSVGRLLEEASPHWTRLVRRFINVVLLRNDVSNKSFSSATTRLAIGRPVLRNPHGEGVTHEVITDGLIHETVHTLLDQMELAYPFVLQPNEVSDVHITSYWTGNQLDLNTFIHACLVWFALFWFWLGALENESAERKETIRLLASRSGGFAAARSLADDVYPYREHLMDGVPDMLAQAQRLVREAVA